MADGTVKATSNVKASSRSQPSGFFQEDNGSNSSMRLMCFVSLLSSICFGILTILNPASDQDNSEGIYITFGFLISAFAPKAVQKFAEQKLP